MAFTCFSRLHAQTSPPKKLRFHTTLVTQHGGAHRESCTFKGLPVATAPTWRHTSRERSSGLPVPRASLILHSDDTQNLKTVRQMRTGVAYLVLSRSRILFTRTFFQKALLHLLHALEKGHLLQLVTAVTRVDSFQPLHC